MRGEIDKKYVPYEKDSPVEFVRLILGGNGDWKIYIRAKRSAPEQKKHLDSEQVDNAKEIAKRVDDVRGIGRTTIEKGNIGVNIIVDNENLEEIWKAVFAFFNLNPLPEPVVSRPKSR